MTNHNNKNVKQFGVSEEDEHDDTTRISENSATPTTQL